MRRKRKLYIKELKEIDYCGNKIIHSKLEEFESPFKVEPTSTKHNLQNCDDCNKTHLQLIGEFNERLNEFPNCCNHHSKLFELNEFVVGNYSDVDKWSADKIIFSYHHFIECIEGEDWYDEIINYFEYCIESFGSFPVKYGEPFLLSSYFSDLINLIENFKKEINSVSNNLNEINLKIDRIVNWLKSFNDEKVYENNLKNFNLLLSKYNEWFSIFPFDLVYFKPLKEKFKRKIPVFKNKRYNKYLNRTSFEIHSTENFAQILINTTKSILKEINGLVLYEKGELNDAEKISLEIILENRRIELSELEKTPNKTTKIYIKTLKSWLKSEKRFIKEITPFLKNKPPKTSNHLRPNRTDIAYYIYYLKETKELKINVPFPSEKAWKEIGELNNKNAKNIQMAYNDICYNSEERLKKSKIVNIRYVKENMLDEYPNALKLAKDELKLAELNS